MKKLKRYIRNGMLGHHGDCRIYSDPAYENCFCSCGLLHDLLPLEPSIAIALYPKFEDDLYKQEKQVEWEATPEQLKEYEEAKRLLDRLFA